MRWRLRAGRAAGGCGGPRRTGGWRRSTRWGWGRPPPLHAHTDSLPRDEPCRGSPAGAGWRWGGGGRVGADPTPGWGWGLRRCRVGEKGGEGGDRWNCSPPAFACVLPSEGNRVRGGRRWPCGGWGVGVWSPSPPPVAFPSQAAFPPCSTPQPGWVGEGHGVPVDAQWPAATKVPLGPYPSKNSCYCSTGGLRPPVRGIECFDFFSWERGVSAAQKS